MQSHYIQYIKRRIVVRYPDKIESPWYYELKEYKNGFDKPSCHITRSMSWPANTIKNGDVIWLVSQLFSPWGNLPPSIDAVIIVDNIEELKDDNNVKLRFDASGDSRWFPLTDATIVLSKVNVVLKGMNITTPYDHIRNNLGQAFQSIKKIHSPKILEEWAAITEKKSFDFISYRVKDGTEKAFYKAKTLIESGVLVFWDRWSLPRRLAERRELVPDIHLDMLLQERIKRAKNVWGILSPMYAEEGSYSAKEKVLADNLNKLILI